MTAVDPHASTLPPPVPRPWLTGIIDLSHWEADMGLHDKRPGPHAANIAGAVHANRGDAHDLVMVFAKTCQGVDSPDPSFAYFRDATRAAGLLFGDYTFLTGKESGERQARDYMARWDPGAEVHVLDVEVNPNDRTSTVTHEHVAECAVTIHDATGVWPLFYTYPSFPGHLRIPDNSPVLNCPLWLATYSERPTKAPRPFRGIELWQYTNAAHGPRDVQRYPRVTPGLGRKVDRSCFDGDLATLKAWLRGAGRDRGPQCEDATRKLPAQ